MFDVSKIISIAKEAGEIILSYYHQQTSYFNLKQDQSPVTQADLDSNNFICNSLSKLLPSLPVISEEDEEHPLVNSEAFWSVDPLDATQSFINRDGEFTVNIALIIDSKPTIGVVYAPISKELYYTDGKIAYRQSGNNKPVTITSRKTPESGAVILTSVHSNNEARLKDYVRNVKTDKIIPLSSSLKICMIAEGVADLYPRFGKTMEWDTAAAHTILLAAGGDIRDLNGNSLTYGHHELHFYNPEFIASGK